MMIYTSLLNVKRKPKKTGEISSRITRRFCKAKLGVWYNGEERLFLRKYKADGQVEFEDIPNIPKYGQRLEDIGKFRRCDLKPTFKAIKNHLAANTVGTTRDEVLTQQLINIIFCKIYDEHFTEPEDIISFRAGVNEVPADVKKCLIDLFYKVKRKYKEVLDKEDNISLDADSIVYVVGELQNFCLIEAERDSVADAFETFIDHALKGAKDNFSPQEML